MTLHWNFTMIVAESCFNRMCASDSGGDEGDIEVVHAVFWFAMNRSAR